MRFDRQVLDAVLAAVLRVHDIDPSGSAPVPFEKMESIARHVRLQLAEYDVADDELHACLDWLASEILDRSMTEAGQRMATSALAKGFGFQSSSPS